MTTELNLLTLLCTDDHERLLDDALRDMESVSRVACRKPRDVDRHLDGSTTAVVISDDAVDPAARRRLRDVLERSGDRTEVPIIVLGSSGGLYREWREQLEPCPVVALTAPCTAHHLTQAVEASMIYRDHGSKLHGAGRSLKDLQEQLYEQFSGLAESLFASSRAGGTAGAEGLSREIVEQLEEFRRSLQVDSRPGTSPFDAIERLAGATEEPPGQRLHDAAKHRPARIEKEVALRFRRLSVLVAEDHDDAREALLQLLHLWGCHFVGVANGRDAVSAAHDNDFDLVLLDLDLPGIDGLEVARRLREELGSSCPMLVAITSFGSEIDRARTHQAGFDLHLVKPVDLDRLRQLLRALGQGSDPSSSATLN